MESLYLDIFNGLFFVCLFRPECIECTELILGRGIAGFTRISHVWRKIEIIMRQRIRIFLLFGAISMLACVKYKYFHDFFVTLLAIETVDRLA